MPNIEIDVNVKKSEFEDFKKDYKNFKREVENKKLDFKINSNAIQKANFNLIEIISTTDQLIRISNKIVPLEKALGIQKGQISTIIYSLSGVVSSLISIKNASNAITKSLGWISLIVTAGSLVKQTWDYFRGFKEEIKLINDSLKDQVNLIASSFKFNKEETELLKQRVNRYEELKRSIKAGQELIENGNLSLEQRKKLEREIVNFKKEALMLEKWTYGIGKEIERQKEKKEEKKEEKKVDKVVSEIEKSLEGYIQIFKDLTTLQKLDLDNKKLYDKKIQDAIQELVLDFENAGKSVNDLTSNELALFSQALKVLGIETIPDLQLKMQGLATSIEQKKEEEKIAKAKEKLEKEAEKALKEVEDAYKKIMDQTAEALKSVGSSLSDIILSIDSFLKGDTEQAIKEVIGSIVNVAGDLLKTFGGVAGQVAGEAVKLVWQVVNSIWSVFNNQQKRERERFLKNQEELRKLQYDRENALREKEIKIRENELKLREENNKKLIKNFNILEQAFLQGVIGLEAYLREVKKKEEREEQIRKEKEELEKAKKETDFGRELQRLKEEFYKKNPDIAGKDLTRDTIEKLLREAKEHQSYHIGRPDEFLDFFGKRLADISYWEGQANKFKQILENFNKFSEKIDQEREKRGLDRLGLAPSFQSSTEQKNNEININFNIKTIVDPSNPESLSKLTNYIIEEINKLKISGVLI